MTKKIFSVVLLALMCSSFLIANVQAHDVNGDGYANWYDVELVMLRFGDTGPPGWIPEDVNIDGIVNIKDAVLVAVQMQITPAIVDIWPDTLVVPASGQGINYLTAIIELPAANIREVDTASLDLWWGVFTQGADHTVIMGSRMRVRFPADRLIAYLRATSGPGLYTTSMYVVGVVLPGALTFMEADAITIRVM